MRSSPNVFRAALPAGTPLIHQPDSTAGAIETYLARHPEYDPARLARGGSSHTGRPGGPEWPGGAFFGEGLSALTSPEPPKEGRSTPRRATPIALLAAFTQTLRRGG